MANPLVSILTPSFNQAPWLADNLASVANQTYPHIEHVVMDGGSTDGSVELLERSSRPELRWKSEPDRGQSHALNKAYADCNGSIVGWINSDDAYVDRRSVAAVVEAFVSDPHLDVVFGHSLLVNETNQVLQFLWSPPFCLPLTRMVTPYFQPAVFFRRTAIGDQMVNEALHFVMDFDLWTRLWGAARFKRINLVIGLERHQPNRKVMSPGYVSERRSYDHLHGMNRTSRTSLIAQRVYASLTRYRAVPLYLDADRHIEPAIPLVWPATRDRLNLQLFTRRASMATSAKR